MSAKRRLGARDSEVRTRLVDAAAEIVREEGCAALTAGRLAKTVGLSRQSVHYYFGTIEDIFIEILRSQAAEVKRRALESFAAGNPLRVIWEFRRATSAMTSELMAMAIRSEAIRTEMARSMEQLAGVSVAAVEDYARRNSVEFPVPAEVVAFVLTNMSYAIALGRELGATAGHEATIDAVEQWLAKFDRN
ncbi:MAG: TetR/AcrR family transcriptional regulator [Novosphingobium sp.]|nr:TetR/AcrR family transcriptional regulator [Novosphingobium sp.]